MNPSDQPRRKRGPAPKYATPEERQEARRAYMHAYYEAHAEQFRQASARNYKLAKECREAAKTPTA